MYAPRHLVQKRVLNAWPILCESEPRGMLEKMVVVVVLVVVVISASYEALAKTDSRSSDERGGRTGEQGPVT